MTTAHPNGLTDLDPLPEIPHDAAEAGLKAMVLALAQGPGLQDDPYALAKVNNFDRLLFDKMPIICAGPSGMLTVGKATL